jgi:thiamine transporter
MSLLRLSDRLRQHSDPRQWDVPLIAELAVAVGLAAALGQFRAFTMPQGGSVSLEMLPIVIVAIRRGVVPGAVAGGLYGLLQLVLPGAFVYHWAQAALDYPLAYAALGAAGLVGVRGWKTLVGAVVAGSAARLIFHFLSGLIFFPTYAPSWEWPWLYALTYNLLFLVPEAAITGVALWPILKGLQAALPGEVPAAR